MAESAVFLEAHVIFPELAATVECMRALAARLSRTDALIWCARANLVVSNPFNANTVAQPYLLDALFPEVPERRHALKWLNDNAPNHGTVFFRAQFLELAFWLAMFSKDLPGDGHTFENAGTRRAFGQAALVAAGLWSNRVNHAIAFSADLPVEELRQHVMADVRASIGENGRGPLPYVAVGRGALMWSTYVPQGWPNSDDVFLDAVELRREDYFRAFAALASQHLDVRPGAATTGPSSGGLFTLGVWDQTPEMREPFRRLLSKITTPIEHLVQLARSINHRGFLAQVKRQPVLGTADGRLIAFDPAFLSAQAIVGPLFWIAARQKGYQCFVDFGNAFEAYVVDLVSTRYPNAEGLAQRSCGRVKLLRGKVSVGDIDSAILTGAGEVCLIEAKAVFLSDDAIQELQSYQSELRRKYASESKRPKGVGQLARAITEFAAGGLTGLPEMFNNIHTVFPMLLAYDNLLDAPGHAAFLSDQFVAALKPDHRFPDGRLRKGNLIVTAPFILSVDDFEWLEASLANFSLGEFLTEYSAADPARASDVRTFALRSRFRRLLRDPESTIDAASKVFADLGRTAFGEAWHRMVSDEGGRSKP